MDLRSLPLCLKMLSAALLAAGLLLSPAARAADEPGQDEVTLKNGGTVRGTVVSSEPGTNVKIIELGQTQARTIPWSQVSDVEKGKYAPKTAAQPGPAGPGYGTTPATGTPQAAAPELKMGDKDVIKLHIDSPLPATVIERRSELLGSLGNYALVATQQRTVCTSPCDTLVDGSAAHVYQLEGDQYPLPGPFGFSGMKGDVTMHLVPGSLGKRAGGVWAIIGGSLALITGATLLPVGLAATTTDIVTDVSVKVPNKALIGSGAAVLVVGVGAIVGGSLLFKSGATQMTIEPSGAAPAKTARITPRYWLGEF